MREALGASTSPYRAGAALLRCSLAAWAALAGCVPAGRGLEAAADPPGVAGPDLARIDLAAAPRREGEIFLHGPYTLYKFAPLAQVVTEVGDFDCLRADQSGSADSGMHDLAVDRDGNLLGVAKVGGQAAGSLQDHVIVSVSPTTGACRKELVIDKRLVDPMGALEVRGLSFLPRGTLDGSADALVALEIGGAYLRIDLRGKQVQLLGGLNGGGPGPWRTKGADVVSIEGEGTYTTAKRDGGDDERLVALDPLTGAVTRDVGSLGPRTTFGGLAYWGGTLYGFTTEGKIFAVDPRTARATELPARAPAEARYDGAGVTTVAPLILE